MKKWHASKCKYNQITIQIEDFDHKFSVWRRRKGFWKANEELSFRPKRHGGSFNSLVFKASKLVKDGRRKIIVEDTANWQFFCIPSVLKYKKKIKPKKQ